MAVVAVTGVVRVLGHHLPIARDLGHDGCRRNRRTASIAVKHASLGDMQVRDAKGVNEHRIDRFDLRRNFVAFFSSCYVGLRKPDEAIYRLALEVTGREPEESVFIDDRPINLEYAARLGMRAIQFEDPAQLERELVRHGVRL